MASIPIFFFLGVKKDGSLIRNMGFSINVWKNDPQAYHRPVFCLQYPRDCIPNANFASLDNPFIKLPCGAVGGRKIKVKELEGKYDLSCLDNPFIKLPCGDVGGEKIRNCEGIYDFSRMDRAPRAPWSSPESPQRP